MLNNYLKHITEEAGFSLQEMTKRINHERPDLVSWRETFLRRIKEIRENEPHWEIVCTDEAWLHAGHRVEKEWVDLKALENPRRSVVDYGTVDCTKYLMDRAKYLIIIDCITENGPIPGALWSFLTESKTENEKSYDFQFTETAVAEEKAREIQNNQTQKEQMTENAPSTSSKEAKNKSIDHHLTKKTKAANVMKSPVEDGNTEEEEAGIITYFDSSLSSSTSLRIQLREPAHAH